MKNTKKLIALMMAITLIVMTFAACGTKKPTEPETTKPVAESTDEATKAEEKTTVAPIEDETKTSEKEDETEATKPVEEPKTEAKEDNPVVTEAPKPKTTEAPKTTDAPKPTEAPKPKQEDKPTENQLSYFKASTGESIQYCSYDTEWGSSTASESNGTFYVKYANGQVATKTKCSNCGKYLCEGGCQPETERKCAFCGRADCERYIADAECIFCGKPVKANTCHYCKQEDIDEYWK